MVTLDVDITASVDGINAPGFPRRVRLVCSQVLIRHDTRSSSASYVNILAGYTPPDVTVKIRFVLIIPDTACNVAINDTTVPANPIALAANSVLMLAGCAQDHSGAGPAIRFQTSTTTNFLVLVGLE